jgi:hypothetical protein
MPRYRHHSLGELISTVSFFGVAVFLVLSGMDWLDQANTTRAYLSWFAAFLCFLGSIRFWLAQMVQSMRRWHVRGQGREQGREKGGGHGRK